MTVFAVYDFVVGMVSVFGLGYLLYAETIHPEYRHSLLLITVGMFALAAEEPLATTVAPAVEHLGHALWLSIVSVGVYGMVAAAQNTDWARLVSTDPSSVRPPAEWMTPLDDHVLELFYESRLVLTPAVIAYNLDYSRAEVNRHLSTLVDAGYVERVERGKYALTPDGEAYLRGADDTPTEDTVRVD